MANDGRLTWRTWTVVLVVAVAVVVGMLVWGEADTTDDDGPGPGPTATASTSATPMSTLVFAVWGTEAEVAAYQRVVDDYNDKSTTVDVTIEAYDDPQALQDAIDAGEVEPDLFLIRHQDLPETMAAGRNQPLQDLLDARDVHTSDGFSRDAVISFSAEDDLQCMPYTASPMVIYYNTDLIDFDRMEERELPVPNEERTSWTLEDFRAAAEFASRPRNHAKGVHIAPTLTGLAPFIYSGAGHLFDDEAEPTSLALGDDDASGAMRETLEVLRDPHLTLTDQQLEQRSPLEWFQAGKLGMIAGYRDLTPIFRQTEDLRFDVMPMPVLGSAATLGELNGVCVTAGARDRVGQAADFLVTLVSDDAVAELTSTGSVVPTNLSVALTEPFLQPGQQPDNAAVFTSTRRSIQALPLSVDWTRLQAHVGASIAALLSQPVLDDLDAQLDLIDEMSRAVLDPDYVEESETPSDDALDPPDSSDSSDDDVSTTVPDSSD
ncbi:multiple sugar transport system substrate-binding protein [Nocardioides thalensis]|uniref:Multiple sugar transport system substrate-binding protein n=1 Tax=Nocardioides thalensis TaxID=1914755 RepID=A0A853BYK2_9ACTN|nr:extracellular solute-binding protein [Nocardioides thalensis]NYJ00031.1 multiple sugar transport system substrate-binding protein [Nocardioides thalensis]